MERIGAQLFYRQFLEADYATTINLCNTSASNRKLCDNDAFWHEKILYKFGVDPVIMININDDKLPFTNNKSKYEWLEDTTDEYYFRRHSNSSISHKMLAALYFMQIKYGIDSSIMKEILIPYGKSAINNMIYGFDAASKMINGGMDIINVLEKLRQYTKYFDDELFAEMLTAIFAPYTMRTWFTPKKEKVNPLYSQIMNVALEQAANGFDDINDAIPIAFEEVMDLDDAQTLIEWIDTYNMKIHAIGWLASSITATYENIDENTYILIQYMKNNSPYIYKNLLKSLHISE